MRAMSRLRIAFADREITLDDFNRGVSLRALWSSGEHLWHPFCSTRLDSAIMRKQPPNEPEVLRREAYAKPPLN